MSDPLLQSFLLAKEEHAGAELQHLLDDEAAPVIAQVLRRRGGSESADLESAAREELITRLLAMRAGEDVAAVQNFRGYAAVVAYHIWAQHLRETRPARSMLLNRLRYLLENRTNQRLFALWSDAHGRRWCALAEWPQIEKNTPKLQWLAADPQAAAQDVFGRIDYRELPFAIVVMRILQWLGVPIELRDFTDALAELLHANDAATQRAPVELANPAPSAIDSAKWREYLGWLWRQLGELSLRQRTAFLLHADVTREFDYNGIASVRAIANALEIPAQEFAAIWNTLPQEDSVIAARLGLQRQQVINLRRVARDRLGAAWREWIK